MEASLGLTHEQEIRTPTITELIEAMPLTYDKPLTADQRLKKNTSAFARSWRKVAHKGFLPADNAAYLLVEMGLTENVEDAKITLQENAEVDSSRILNRIPARFTDYGLYQATMAETAGYLLKRVGKAGDF